jgi:hypothetical protein
VRTATTHTHHLIASAASTAHCKVRCPTFLLSVSSGHVSRRQLRAGWCRVDHHTHARSSHPPAVPCPRTVEEIWEVRRVRGRRVVPPVLVHTHTHPDHACSHPLSSRRSTPSD